MSLSWEDFGHLEGSPEDNFELLWRGVVQRHWGRFGVLRSVRQQPGVEFHLRLDEECDLGEPGRWYGWQCRWYKLKQDNGLYAAQKESIRKSIRTTAKHLPGVTDYVLCLKERPSKDDVDWYFALTPEEVGVEDNELPRLHLWDQEDLEPRLTGSAAELRQAYFGELVVTADQLNRTRERSLFPVRDRWMPEVNVQTHVERDVLSALLRPGSCSSLEDQAEFLEVLFTDTGQADENFPADFTNELEQLRDLLRSTLEHLHDVIESVNGRDPNTALELLRELPDPEISPAQIRQLARTLRAVRHPIALPVSAAEESIREARRQLVEIRHLAGAGLIAVVGDPGQGKSHLCAEVTEPSEDDLAGVFLAGRDLHHGSSLDELVSRIPELKLDRVDDLLEMLDAAGARAGQRVAVVIDGLNEAERPQEWQAQLASLQPALSRFPNTVVIVTLRATVSKDVLVPGTHELRLRWSEDEVHEVVGRYFTHYKIDPGSSRLPGWLLADPLFLRLFCEAVNGDRQDWVGAEAIPDDLVSVYELFRDKVSERLSKLLSLRPDLIPEQLAAVAMALWERQARDLPFEEVRDIVEESKTEWDRSLVRAFEQEGIFSRDPDQTWEFQRTSVLFDRFAGFLIADALVRGKSPEEVEALLTSQRFWGSLFGDQSRRHPLAEDIFVALIGVVPRRLHQKQLWQFAPQERVDETLNATLQLSSDLIDDETQSEIAKSITLRCKVPNRYNERHSFDLLWDFHDSPGHRLNAKFLDRVLRGMPVATRDRFWSEWLRTRTNRVGSDLMYASKRWANQTPRGPQDDVRALAIAWVTTSSNRRLRDQASLALQRYGSKEPRRMFVLAVKLGEVDDPYVVDRLLAACVGSALTQQMPDPGEHFRRPLQAFLATLTAWYIEPAGSPTSHVQIRDHVRTLFEFAAKLHPESLPPEIDPNQIEFAPGPTPVKLEEQTPEGSEVDQTLGMDFRNYTVGSLYESRGNYDFDHADWNAGISQIRGRVWELGWRSEHFEDIDKRIAEASWRGGHSDDADRVERYGKKYGRIAHLELAGRLGDEGVLEPDESWRHEVPQDIDPTFPRDPSPLPFDLPEWATGPPTDDRQWFENGEVDIPEDFVIVPDLGGETGPWILVSGNLTHRSLEHGREVWGHFRAMLVDGKDAGDVTELLENRPYLGNRFVPGPPTDYYTYAGEMPWSDRFMARGRFGWGDPPYEEILDRPEGEIRVEVVAHEYNAETGALELPARGCDVPSARIAEHFDLRQLPGTLDLVGLDGRSASKTFRAPDGFGGQLLYIREDLIREYASDRSLVQVAWGERRVLFGWNNRPDWFAETAENADVWRRISLPLN